MQAEAEQEMRENFSIKITKFNDGLTSEDLITLNPRYMTRISCRVNFVSRQRSSRATGMGLGKVRLVVSNSYTTSSMGLSGGVAIFYVLNYVMALILSAN